MDTVLQKFKVQRELGQDLVKLALFDIILYIGSLKLYNSCLCAKLTVVDNSGSMKFEEEGERINDLRVILSRVVFVASLFDEDGINIRFIHDPFPDDRTGMNPRKRELDNVRSEQQVDHVMNIVEYRGLTPIGTELEKQIIKPFVFGRRPTKPILVIIITDGAPAGEDKSTLSTVIKNTAQRLDSMPGLGRNTVSYQIAQVGKDQGATNFLTQLDNDQDVGKLIDCTSSELRSLSDIVVYTG